MIKLLTIIGARPQIIKAAAISRAIQNGFSDKITENMSQVFFGELGIQQPYLNACMALFVNKVRFPKLY